jgi:perosamine synthetase
MLSERGTLREFREIAMKAIIRPTIPLSEPKLAGNEWAYIKECLDTNWVSYQGPFVERFEKELASRCGSGFAVATSSGTAALHLALEILGVEPDSEVLMPAITFVAPANAVRYCGAWPTLIDIAADDWQIDVQKLADFLEKRCIPRNGSLYNTQTGRRISALLPVNLLGDICDVDAICTLATQYGLPLIEDAAECLGAKYKGRNIAAPTEAIDNSTRIVITSFNGNKIVTTGGGGALLMNDANLAQRAKHLSTTAKSKALEFYHDEVGYNYRLTNIAAALGVAQLEQLDTFVADKKRIAHQYVKAFKQESRITLHAKSRYGDPIYWLNTITTEKLALPIIMRVNDVGIMCRPLWTPLALLPAFQERSYSYECNFAQYLWKHAISLPSSVGISDADIDYVASTLQGELQT